MNAGAGGRRGFGFLRLSDHTFVDYATQVYLAIVSLLILFFYDGPPARRIFLLSATVLCLLAIQVLIRAQAWRPENRLLDFLRHFYPILLYAGLYCEVGELNQMFVKGYADGFFQRLEERLFGCQPSIRFMEKLPYLPISELFYMAYFSYYVMILGLGVIFYIRDKQLFWRYVSLVSFVFYVCYLIFILLPVVGPYERVEALGGGQFRFVPVPYPAAVQAGPFFQLMKLIYEYAEAPSAAFPSSHVAVALCTIYFSWRFIPRIRWIHLAVVILLCSATVYCRYHYLVDVFAGALTAGLLIPIGEWLYRKTGGASGAKTVTDS